MAKYLSNKFKSLKIGIDSFSENLTSLAVVGKVGIGSTLSLNSVTGIVSAVSFKRHGGSSSEFLMADGSVNNSSFLSSYTETDTLDNVLGRGNVSGIGLSVGVVTATSFNGTINTVAQPNITSLGTLTSLTVQGNVSVGGTLTYDDVTNVDSLGIVTARSGIHVGPISAGVATVTTDGNATFTGIITSGQLNVTGISTLSNTDINGNLGLKKTINTQYSPTTAVTPIITIRNDASLNNSFASLRLQAHNANAAAAAFNISVLNGSTNYKSTLVLQSRDTENDHSEKLRITDTGNIGIGITQPINPGHKTVHIHESASSQPVRIHMTTVGTGATAGDGFSLSIDGNNKDINLIQRESADMRFYTAGSERLRITGIGSVGIGTDLIEAPLHVAGANSRGIVALFGAKDFIDNANYNYDNATIGLHGENPSGTYQGSGVQYITRNSGLTNWHHGYTTFDRVGDFHIGLGGFGNTKATDKITILSTGAVGIGTTIAKEKLHVVGVVSATSFFGDGSNLSNLPASGISDVVSDSSPQLGGNLDVNGKDITGTGNANLTGIVTATTFSSGLLRIGYSTSIPLAGGFDPSIQQVGTNLNSSTFGLYRFTADSSAPSIRFIKSRSSDPSSRGLVQFGDELGRISFIGDDGNDIANGGALISAHVDGVASATADMPARLSFHTAPDGTAGGQERLTIKNDGKIGIGNTLPTQMLDVGGTVKATSFSGNGANLTSLSAANLTGSLPAISGANLTDVLTTGVGGQTGNLTVAGIASVGIGTAGDPLVGKVDLFHEGEIRLKTTPAGIQVVGVLSATSLDFTGANGAFNDDLLLKGASANAKWDKSESYLQINDGAKVVFGSDVSSGDLEIYHSGSQSYINEDGTGELLITTGIGTTAAMVSDGSITLYHEGVERLKTTASGVTISGNINGTISGTINGNASTATDLAITGATEQLVIQTGNNATDVIASGTAGYILQSNGSGNAPTWAAGAPANAISGITLREDGVLVGSANSISTINFTGAGVGVTFTQPTAGIATVTISAGGGDSASPVMMSMIFG